MTNNTSKVKSELWKIQTSLKTTTSHNRKSITQALDNLKSLEKEICPKTSPSENISLHHICEERADISSATREHEKVAAEISSVKAKLLKNLSSLSNIKPHSSSAFNFTGKNQTSQEYLYYLGLYATDVAIKIGNSYLASARHYGIAAKTSSDIGGAVGYELDVEDAKENYKNAINEFQSGGFNQYSIKIILECVSFLWSLGGISGESVYRLEGIELLKLGKKLISEIISNKNKSSIEEAEIQMLLVVVGGELLSKQLEFSLVERMENNDSSSSLSNIKSDLRLRTAKDALDSAVWLVSYLDSSQHTDFYEECYHAQILLILLHGPPKQGSELDKLLQNIKYNNNNNRNRQQNINTSVNLDYLETVVQAYECRDLETLWMLYEDYFIEKFNSGVNSIILLIILRLEEEEHED